MIDLESQNLLEKKIKELESQLEAGMTGESNDSFEEKIKDLEAKLETTED